MLARDLGKTVGEMLASMSAEEMTYWRALYNTEAEERRRGRADAKAMELARDARPKRKG